jgi:hypothetical protein
VERYFTKYEIPFEKRDIQHSQQFYKEWHEAWKGEIVPTIIFDGGKQVVDGYDIPAIKRAMKTLGITLPQRP